MDIVAEIRRIARLDGRTHPLGLDEFGNLTTSKGLPDLARLSAAGKLFQIDMSAGTAKAPVVAPPVASPEWGLYNFSQNETMVVLSAACGLKSGTQGLGLAMMMASAIGPQTAVTADYSGTIKNSLDGSKDEPQVYLANNPTLIGGTPAWHIVANDQGNTIAQVNIGSGLVADNLQGRYTAKPNGGMVCLEVVGPTGTTALFWVSFLVAMLDLRRKA